MKHLDRWWLGWLFVLAACIFSLHYVVSGQAVYGDGIGYYAHLRSWYFDHDWNYTNEYRHIYSPENNNETEPLVSDSVQIVATTADGRAENHYSPGTAVLLVPFYVLADSLVLLANSASLELARNGYSHPYQISIGLGAIIYVIAGLFFLEQLVHSKIQDKVMSKLVAVLIFLGTQLLYYGSFDVINSHHGSFFLACCFFFVLFTHKKAPFQPLILGLLAGLATTVRIQDGVLLLVWWLQFIGGLKTEKKPQWKLSLRELVQFHSGFIITISTSIMHHLAVFNSPLPLLYMRPFFQVNETKTQLSLLGSLLHPTTGLFVITPVLAIAFGAFLYLALKKQVTRELWLMAFFFGCQYLIITIQSGWPAAAYGGRMYISSLPFFALALAIFLKNKVNRLSYSALGFFVLLLSLFNFWQMGNFILFGKGTESGAAGTEMRTKQRIEKLRDSLPFKQ